MSRVGHRRHRSAAAPGGTAISTCGRESVSITPVRATTSGSPCVPERIVVRFTSFLDGRYLVVPAPQSTDTSFRHSIHKSLACTGVSWTGTTHGGLKFTPPAGCMGCHHGPQQKAQCATCHKTTPTSALQRARGLRDLGAPESVDARDASDPFTHERHAALTCARCHASDAKRTVATTTCTSCHADHHTAAANCASCHKTTNVGHDRSVHAGCAGCHTDRVWRRCPRRVRCASRATRSSGITIRRVTARRVTRLNASAMVRTVAATGRGGRHNETIRAARRGISGMLAAQGVRSPA